MCLLSIPYPICLCFVQSVHSVLPLLANLSAESCHVAGKAVTSASRDGINKCLYVARDFILF